MAIGVVVVVTFGIVVVIVVVVAIGFVVVVVMAFVAVDVVLVVDVTVVLVVVVLDHRIASCHPSVSAQFSCPHSCIFFHDTCTVGEHHCTLFIDDSATCCFDHTSKQSAS